MYVYTIAGIEHSVHTIIYISEIFLKKSKYSVIQRYLISGT